MLVGELIELTFKEPLNKIAKEKLTIGERAARDALKAAGCYNISGKRGWYFEGDESILKQSIYDFASVKKPKAKKDNIVVNVHDNIPENTVVVDPEPVPDLVVDHAAAIDLNDDIDQILKDDNRNKVNKIQKGIYFEPEVARALDKLVKKKKQSELVNAAVRQVLKAKGLL
jgi:hypothetical protein